MEARQRRTEENAQNDRPDGCEAAEEKEATKNGLRSALSSVRWKNPRAKPNEMYRPTTVEHVANIATHGVR